MEPEEGGLLENWEPLPTSEPTEINQVEQMLDALLDLFQPSKKDAFPDGGTANSNGTIESWEPIADEVKYVLSPNQSGPVAPLPISWLRRLKDADTQRG